MSKFTVLHSRFKLTQIDTVWLDFHTRMNVFYYTVLCTVQYNKILINKFNNNNNKANFKTFVGKLMYVFKSLQMIDISASFTLTLINVSDISWVGFFKYTVLYQYHYNFIKHTQLIVRISIYTVLQYIYSTVELNELIPPLRSFPFTFFNLFFSRD